MPQFTNIQIVVGGQSQAGMALTSGGETSEPVLSSFPPAFTYLRDRLAALSPGATVQVSGTAGGQSTPPPQYSYIAGAPLMFFDATETGNRWWNAYNGTPGNAYEPLRDFINSRGGAGRICFYLHYAQTQDCCSAFWNEAAHRTNLRAFYQKVFDDCSGNFARFLIQPVVNQGRGTCGAANLGAIRRSFLAVSGVEPVAGTAPLPFVLPAVTATAWNTVDGAHTYRSVPYRAAELLAQRFANRNGDLVPTPDPPVLYRAVQVGPTTVRAYISSPGGFPIRVIGGIGSTAWFTITGGGTATGVGTVDNSQVATLRRATIDVTFSGTLEAGSRLAWSAGSNESSYSVTNEPPSGNLRNLIYSDPTGFLTAITQACEDVVGSPGVVHADVRQSGVPIERL